MRFTKMHGIGNDYIFINCLDRQVDNPSQLSQLLSDRHFGAGSDGLVLIMPSDKADFRMRMFNPDGSEAEMCGNAIRCVGKYVYDNGFTDKNGIAVETLAGIRQLEMKASGGRIESVRVDMGKPIMEPSRIPVDFDGDRFISEPVTIEGVTYSVTCVSMGNPHAVAYIKDIKAFPLDRVGPLMENHSLFPDRINAEFAVVEDRNTVSMRVWERGAGETLACGTGACAVLAASVLNNLTDRTATLRLPGGDLLIEWSRQDGHIYMTGPAVRVYEGEACIEDIIKGKGIQHGKDQ